MGLITSTYRMMYLTAYQLSLETKLEWIVTAMSELGTSSDEILSLGNDLDPQNPAVKQLEARRQKLSALEKRLDVQKQEYETRLKMVNAELESCKGAVDKAIERSFQYSV